VLLLTGHEGVYARIMASVLLVRFVLIAILGHSHGLIGAVAGWSISTVVLALALIIACRRLVGLDPSLSFALRSIRPSMVRVGKDAS
jgi:O-antigen/teichoic acid export membrane protein